MGSKPATDLMPYSKICHVEEDFPRLEPFIGTVIRHPSALAGQHPIRAWEYAMALRTIEGWERARFPQEHDRYRSVLQIADIGGAGSNFWHLLQTQTAEAIHIIDPNTPENLLGYLDHASQPPQRVWYATDTVEAFLAKTSADQFDVLTCISVLEHVKETRPFLRAAHTLLKPGGLLFLTMDYWDAEGDDCAHFHWMRERIYNPILMRSLRSCCQGLGFRLFGPPAVWNGVHPPQVYDYSVASLALVKA